MIDLRKRPKTSLAAALSATALLGAGGGAATYAALGSGETTIVRTTAVESSAQPAAATTDSTVAEIYKRVSGAVVEITVSSANGQAQGSGFVYDDEGHVITNHHVVEGADTVSVKFSDGSTHDGTVLGSDPSTDLAVIEVDAPASLLQPLDLADSDELEVGDGAIAIGSPFGLEQTVTAGIVSALHRQITAPDDFAIDDVIQTDAAINHGNSGGPLLDFEGRVIGVNSQIESDSGGNVGIGFAVPSNTVEEIATQLISGGEVEHAYLGVGIESIPAAAADELELEEGAAVVRVSPGAPAADAGLRAASGSQIVDGQAYPTGGDVITEVDGERVRDADELRRAIDAHRPGDTVELTVVRDGVQQSVEVTLEARPAA
ncbi:MAG TPA: trypsin-like peptidase domain-containing protein [Gaiellaceae bacterium]|nr:trypsin-like peptidase domain-containing protein [Gaiellaceae bacterium]